MTNKFCFVSITIFSLVYFFPVFAQHDHNSHNHDPHKEQNKFQGKQPLKKLYPLNYCLVTGEKLGSMGEPLSIVHNGQEFKVCCKGCVKKLKENIQNYMKKLETEVSKIKPKKNYKQPLKPIPYSLDYCLITGQKLGSMGEPITITREGYQFKLCCKGCIKKLNTNLQKYLKELKAATPKKIEPRMPQQKIYKQHKKVLPYPFDFCLNTGRRFSDANKPISIVHKGIEFKFCSKFCVNFFKASPEKYLKELKALTFYKRPKTNSLENELKKPYCSYPGCNVPHSSFDKQAMNTPYSFDYYPITGEIYRFTEHPDPEDFSEEFEWFPFDERTFENYPTEEEEANCSCCK